MKRNGCQPLLTIFLCTLLMLPFYIQSGGAVSSSTVVDDIILDLANPRGDFSITNSGEWGTDYSDQGKGIAVPHLNQIFTIGTSYLPGVTYGVLLAKWNATAGLIWGKTINEAGSSLVHAVTADSHFVYLIGSTPSLGGSDSLVLKVNQSGTVSWIQTLDYGEYETARDVVVSEDGSVYVLIAPTGPLPVLVKLGSNGSLVWDRIINSPEFHSSRQLSISPDGSVYTLTSQYLTKWDEDGNVIWNIEGSFHSISPSSDGSIYSMTHPDIVILATGDSHSILKDSAISMNFYCNISKWSRDGDELITRRLIVQNDTEILYIIAVDLVVSPEGDVYSLLSVYEQPYIIMKLNANLDSIPEWSPVLNEIETTYRINSIAAVGDGVIYAEGSLSSPEADANLTLIRFRGQVSTTHDINSRNLNAIILAGVVGIVVVIALVVTLRPKP